MTAPVLQPRGVRGVASKLHDDHLQCLAIVYVRQSHPQHVVEHVESTARPYALVDRAVAWGWARDRVVVIDADQGQSGQSMVTRVGLQRVGADVSLDHVGLILGLELRRLARSNKDWHPWLALWAIFRTLWADADGLSDPTDATDRFLGGLRGMLSEAALSLMKGRMLEGMRHKARRGALLHHPPRGDVRGPDGEDQLAPDAQAQRVIRLRFATFEEHGSLPGVLRSLVAHDMRVPMRPHCGPHRGQLVWRRPTRRTVPNLLHHPISAGASRWGHRTMEPRQQPPGRRSPGRTLNVPEACDVLLPNRLPASISWERFAAIPQRLADNRAIADAGGAPRAGPSFLVGVLVCGRCGRRLLAAYGGKAKHRRSTCRRATLDDGAPGCRSLAGAFLERCVATQIRQVLQPASGAVRGAAEQALRAARARGEAHGHQRLERARSHAQRAARHYAAGEPDNRLVAREVARRWEEALGHAQQRHEA